MLGSSDLMQEEVQKGRFRVCRSTEDTVSARNVSSVPLLNCVGNPAAGGDLNGMGIAWQGEELRRQLPCHLLIGQHLSQSPLLSES